MMSNQLLDLLRAYEYVDKKGKKVILDTFSRENTKRGGDWTTFLEALGSDVLTEVARTLSTLLDILHVPNNVAQARTMLSPFGIQWSPAEIGVRWAMSNQTANAWDGKGTQVANTTRAHLIGLLGEEVAYEYCKTTKNLLATSWPALYERRAVLAANTPREKRAAKAKFAGRGDITRLHEDGKWEHIEVKSSRKELLTCAVTQTHVNKYLKDKVDTVMFSAIDLEDRKGFIALESPMNEVKDWKVVKLNGVSNRIPSSFCDNPPSKYSSASDEV